jgi:hypothetical protein
MAMVPNNRDLLRKQEVLEEFAEAQGGRKVGARPMDQIEGTTIGDDINLRVSSHQGSTVLGAALRAAGIAPPGSGYHAHHIVPRGMQGAQRAREILERAGIGIDSAENGVWLPGNSSAVNADGSLIHQGIHSGQYLNHITRILAGAETGRGSEAVRSAMARLRQRIHDATAVS